MKSTAIFLLMLLLVLKLNAQQQININRIQQMPDMPSPYEIRDWKNVAEQYDSLIFSLTSQGTHLPLMSLGTEGVNYPEIKPIFLDSYVGSTSHGQQREAINIIPAMIGASLVGIDKKTQFGIDWVDKVKDFYNLKNGELVYLNGPSDKSGNDWWYETMPNIFFYQLYDLYPNTPGFEAQFREVADRWLEAVKVMGGATTPWQVPYMNYRAWNLKTMQPLVDGVKEPEAAGAIAWILYQAYKELGDDKYLVGAQWSMDYLDGLTSNPSYELQLPYGVLAAAKMNAEIGTNYDVEKMLNWCFSRGALRGWGSIVGNWGGTDVSGLIGEANDQGDDYAFIMNGFQLAAAVVPLVKYDKRFAASIGKWVLNTANASRLFYAAYVPEDHQSDYTWSTTFDPKSVIAYESIKEKWEGKTLYSRGDAKNAGWASTNLGLYGSSHVGYLGAIVEQTNVDGILKLDANATDFFGPNPFPTFVIYNPFSEAKQITLQIGNEAKDLYDAISETILLQNVSGETQVTIPTKGALLISYIPSGATTNALDGKLLVDNQVLDHHYGYDFDQKLRIKSMSATANPVEKGVADTIYCTVDFPGSISYQWTIDGQAQQTTTDFLIWTPEQNGTSKIKVNVQSATQLATDSLVIEVVDLIAQDPIINRIFTEDPWQLPSAEIWVKSEANDPKNLELTYNWAFDAGQILEANADSVKIKLPASSGVFPLQLTLKNSFDKEAVGTLQILVLAEVSDQEALLYLPLDGNAKDQGGNGFATSLQGTSYVSDAQNSEGKALAFSSSSDELRISNTPQLNFGEEITVSCWLQISDFSEERFIISHGGWAERWKLSVTTDKKIRWTINTKDGIKDLDNSFTIEKSVWYHVSASYTGSAMVLYIDGALDTYAAHLGAINSSISPITVGKQLTGDVKYFWKGRIDEVKIFDRAISPTQTETLPTIWWDGGPALAANDINKEVQIFPNPTSRYLYVKANAALSEIFLVDMTGRQLAIKTLSNDKHQYEIDLGQHADGIYSLVVDSGGVKTASRIIIRK
jgi:hypothetical protein